MTRWNIALSAVMAFAVGAGCSRGSLIPERSDDDGRPAIIVRGGSVEFESQRGWSRLGKSNNWNQNPHPGPRATTGLRVRKVGGAPCELSPRSSFVQVRYRETSGTERRFNIRFAGNHVILQSPVDLAGSGNVLTHSAAGEILAVEDELAPSDTCPGEPGSAFEIVPQK